MTSLVGSVPILTRFPTAAAWKRREVNTKWRTHGWQTGVPGGGVVAAAAYADVAVVHLGRTEAAGSPRVLQFLILLPSQAC